MAHSGKSEKADCLSERREMTRTTAMALISRRWIDRGRTHIPPRVQRGCGSMGRGMGYGPDRVRGGMCGKAGPMAVERRRGILGLAALMLMAMVWMPTVSFGGMETVSLPVTLEYPFIRALLIEQLYNAPGQRAIVVDEDGTDCAHIELSDPEVTRELSMIKVGTRILIRAGIPILGTCMGQFEWQGYIEVMQRPLLDADNWRIHFETVDSRIFDANRKPIRITSRLWDLIKTYVHPYLGRTSVELAPPLQEIKGFLSLAFLPEDRKAVDRWLATIRPDQVRVEEESVKVNLRMDVQPVSRPRRPAEKLSAVDVERLSGTWEKWDALLVREMESLIGGTVTDAERRDLLAILLENRYEFLDAIDRRTIDSDLVRRQFIRTWQRLSLILRKCLVNQKSRPPLSYLAFFTASDALVALDRLGPSIGLEINRDGLVRLAKLLSASETDPALDYSYSVNPLLRESLGMGPPLDDLGPASDILELDLPEEQALGGKSGGGQSWILHLLFPRAWAAEGPPALFERVKEWITPAADPERYIGKVRDLLEGTADQVLVADPSAREYETFFRRLLLATVWQESCWRQFVVKGGKLRYLVSYNQTSTGLMQINERVWRGIYRVESLRWNIAYNAKAGTEILHLYLRNFALKELKPGTPADFDTVARVTYAIYNGGPGQFRQFFKRSDSGALYRSDRLFWEKYALAGNGDFQQIVQCISGQ